ncbi:hypothetical protein ACNQ1M_01005 [Mycoplasma sp. VS424B]|uniref:hypothetical protein n=1 Tax=Mycoplasma sp. VS424B TaxID=3401660 RepID=UPI003AAD681D
MKKTWQFYFAAPLAITPLAFACACNQTDKDSDVSKLNSKVSAAVDNINEGIYSNLLAFPALYNDSKYLKLDSIIDQTNKLLAKYARIANDSQISDRVEKLNIIIDELNDIATFLDKNDNTNSDNKISYIFDEYKENRNRNINVPKTNHKQDSKIAELLKEKSEYEHGFWMLKLLKQLGTNETKNWINYLEGKIKNENIFWQVNLDLKMATLMTQMLNLSYFDTNGCLAGSICPERLVIADLVKDKSEFAIGDKQFLISSYIETKNVTNQQMINNFKDLFIISKISDSNTPKILKDALRKTIFINKNRYMNVDSTKDNSKFMDEIERYVQTIIKEYVEQGIDVVYREMIKNAIEKLNDELNSLNERTRTIQSYINMTALANKITIDVDKQVADTKVIIQQLISNLEEDLKTL